jgi:hypothetical protein
MVDLEDKTRKYLEEKVKIYAHFMLGFGNIEASEEMVANRELIKNKKEYTFEQLPVMSECETLKIKFLNKRVTERFESYEEYCSKKDFWSSK